MRQTDGKRNTKGGGAGRKTDIKGEKRDSETDRPRDKETNRQRKRDGEGQMEKQ